MKTEYFDKMEDLPDLGTCPMCGAKLARVWGNGFDYDLAQCPARRCDYFRELPEDTGLEYGSHGRIYHITFEQSDFE